MFKRGSEYTRDEIGKIVRPDPPQGRRLDYRLRPYREQLICFYEY